MFCSEVFQVRLVLSLLFYTSVSGARSQVDPGKHCVDIQNPSGPGTVEACASCFFPQNCLGTNVCLTGTVGDLCERCVHYSSHNGHNTQGYYRVGNSCTQCLSFPWALIGLGIFLVITLMNVAYTGLTPSVATKIKQVTDFLQYMILAFSIKVAWSNTITRAVLVFTFSFFSAGVATPACLVPESVLLYYMEWGVSVAFVLLFLVLTCFLDFRKRSQMKQGGIPLPAQKKIWRKRAQYRRLTYLILMMFYIPVAVSAIQSFSCTASLYPESLALYPGKELFLYDLTFDCDEVGFSAINSWSTLLMVAYTCFLPVFVLLFTLRQRKWGFLQSAMIQYGHVYEIYKDRWCFWEAFVMLRKLAYVIITNTYPISPSAQAIGHLSVTGIFLLATVVFRPFRKYTWKPGLMKIVCPTTVFEVLSMLCIMILETQGLLIAYQIIVPALDWVFIMALAITLIFWLICVLSVQYEHKIEQFENFEVPQSEKKVLLAEECGWTDQNSFTDEKESGKKSRESVKKEEKQWGNGKPEEKQQDFGKTEENRWDNNKTEVKQWDNAKSEESHREKSKTEEIKWSNDKTEENEWDNTKTGENGWDSTRVQKQKLQGTDRQSEKREYNSYPPNRWEETNMEAKDKDAQKNDKISWSANDNRKELGQAEIQKTEFEDNSDNSSLF